MQENTTSSLASETFVTLPPEYIFDRRDEDRKTEYQQFAWLPSVFSQNGDPAPGIVTTHDEFAISFTREEQIEKVEALLATRTEAEARKLFRLCSQSQWDYGQAKKELRDGKWRDEIVPILYRPFDVRFTVYNRHVAVHRRERVSAHMLNRPNVAVITTRQTKDDFSALATKFICGHKSGSRYDIGYVFPLWLDPEWTEATPRSNIEPALTAAVAQATELTCCEHRGGPLSTSRARGDLHIDYGPEDLFDQIYAVLHSGTYRERYAEFLKADFPRVPLPRSTALFRALAERGRELVELHLLESRSLSDIANKYTGPVSPEVNRVGWSDGTVWLDAGKTNAREGHRATSPGTIGFTGVPKEVWDFHIGGYQVCHKWLKDRKGRTLSDADIAHYQKIVVAFAETIRLMTEIDEVIEQHGGWPGAFQHAAEQATEAAATPKVVPFRRRTVEPKPEERYVTCVPLVPLKTAAGAFGDPQRIEDDDVDWIAIDSRHRLRKGMFVARVVGNSMEPAIPDGSYCLFRAPVEGTRQGKTVLVQLRDATDPETGQRYTVKRYKSEKNTEGDSWRHTKITLEPVNRDFGPIVLTGDEGELQVIAELVEVLDGGAPGEES